MPLSALLWLAACATRAIGSTRHLRDTKQAQTVRGFLAGLAKKGIKVDVLERVRQVGPGKLGAKDSYSVYRPARG